LQVLLHLLRCLGNGATVHVLCPLLGLCTARWTHRAPHSQWESSLLFVHALSLRRPLQECSWKQTAGLWHARLCLFLRQFTRFNSHGVQLNDPSAQFATIVLPCVTRLSV
jgi:hypothetical protein